MIWRSEAWAGAGRVGFWLTRWALRLPVWPFTAPRVRVVIIAEGRVLVVRQWFGEQKWELPGGGMKAGETSYEAARREIDEEVGLELGELEDGGLYRPAGRACVWQVVRATLDQSSPLLITRPYEILTAAWVPLHELDDRSIEGATRDIVGEFVIQERKMITEF